MFEHHVGELPEEVVGDHQLDGGVVIGGVGARADPEHVVGVDPLRVGVGDEPHGGAAPWCCAASETEDLGVVRRPEEQEDVAGTGGAAQRGADVVALQRHRGHRSLAHDHGVQELDREMRGMRWCRGSHAPQRCAVRDAAGEVQRGDREVVGKIATEQFARRRRECAHAVDLAAATAA